MFLKYSTRQIPPKKSIGKDSQGKKTVDVSQEIVDVFEESEPKPAKKKTGSRSTRGVVIQDPLNALNKKTSRRQPGTEGSSKGTSRIPRVPDESIVVSATSHKGTGTKPGVPDEEKVIPEANKKDKDGDADDEGDDHISDIQDTDDDDAETITPPANKQIYVMSIVRCGGLWFGTPVKGRNTMWHDMICPAPSGGMTETESDEDEICKYMIRVHKDEDEEMLNAEVEDSGKVISKHVVPTPIPVTPSVAPATTLLTPSSVSTIPHVPHQTTAPIPTPLITIDAPNITIVVLKSNPALETSKIQKPTIDLEQESEKSASKIRKIKRELAEKQNIPKNPDNHALYHALMKALIEDENAMDKGVADTVKNHKRQHDDDDDDDDDDCWELKVFTLSTAKPKTLYCSRLQLPLAILGENISQEDLNLNFLRSLPSEWNTYVVVWRNKPDLYTTSFDDLYNNFKIFEQELKGNANSSLSSSSQNVAFVSSLSSTNEVITAYGVSIDNSQVNPASTQVSTANTQFSAANLSDTTFYAFLVSQPNGSHLVHEDLEQIHEDDLEEMDLKWQLALLSMRTIEGPRNQDNKSSYQDRYRRTINVEEISSKAMLAIDEVGFDWSFMADEEVPTDMALMAFSYSEPKFEGYGPKTSKSVSEDISNEIMKSPDTLLVEELVSDDKLKKKIVFPTIFKIEFVRPQQQQKSVRKPGHPQKEDQGYVNSVCLRHITGNMSYLSDFKEFDGGFVTFGGGAKRGRITGKVTLKTSKLNFEDVYFVKELQFNLFSISQMCDKKNSVLFTDTGCFVLSPNFKLTDES
ncbi:hypothetical protein Tco_0319887 [Tanacetum coccineum]